LRVRSNTPFRIVMARTNFSATNLQYKGSDVSGSTDGGSFITVVAGPDIRPTGSKADSSACAISPVLGQGLLLSQVSAGTPSKSSTAVISGGSVSRGGNAYSVDNAVDIPVQFRCASGMDIGPVSGTNGSFQCTVELAAFTGS
jgi:hypothetical protein